MREVHVGVGVHVGRGVWTGPGVDVDLGAGVRWGGEVFGLVVLEVVFLGVVLLDVVLLDVDEDVDLGEVVSLVSCSGRSSTGGGSEGAAATRKPSSTSRGTHSSAASSMPSRPIRRPVLMASTLGNGDDTIMSTR